MTEVSLQNIDVPTTRLVQFLSDMAVTDVPLTHTQFSQRLGQLIDIGESMKLSAFHDKLQSIGIQPAGDGSPSPVSPKDEVLRIRLLLVNSVLKSFVEPEGVAGVKLPIFKAGMPLDQLATFEPYHRFYLSHQREFEYKIQRLQFRVRDSMSLISTELAQLAALDETIREALLPHTRKNLTMIPKLLGRRFERHLQEYLTDNTDALEDRQSDQPDEEILRVWTQSGGWLNQFFTEMQKLLLAELELRLQPALGLLEAIDEQVEQSDD